MTDRKHPLARWRALHGVTQQQLADDIGAHQTTIARVEGGDTPSLPVALKIAARLKTSVELIWNIDPDRVDKLLDAFEELSEISPMTDPERWRDAYSSVARESAKLRSGAQRLAYYAAGDLPRSQQVPPPSGEDEPHHADVPEVGLPGTTAGPTGPPEAGFTKNR